MPSDMFRRAAMDRLASPEQLDQMIRVTSPRGWLALWGLGMVLATAVVWSVVGRVPTRVFGQGILIKPGGVRGIHSSLTGQLTRLAVKEGDVVEPGQVVAGVFQAREDASSQVNYITSPHAGRILEIMVDQGNTIQAGTMLMSLESMDRTLEAVIYAPVADGKKVQPGMRVQISPSTVKQEEHGYMYGIVRTVAEFPSTPQGMMRVVENPKLVERLSGGDAPIQIYVDLIAHAGTPSGYKWSSRSGPPSAIHRGTICSASIAIKEQPPITLVIPALKDLMGF